MHINEPDFWLVFETDGYGECDRAPAAVAAHLLPTNDDDPDVGFLVGIARAFNAEQPNRRVVSVSDLTRWLAAAGFDWDRLDVDLRHVLSALSAHASRPGTGMRAPSC